jgi:uncharacterized protein involved in exopolysaccharide biosynthesis
MTTHHADDQVAPNVVYVMHPASSPGSDGTDLLKMIQAAWLRRWWIFGFTALATAIGIAYALLAAPVYRAEVVLLPRDSKSGSGLSAQLGQLGGLADLAGISIGATSTQEPLGVLRSRGFARRFIIENKLLSTLVTEAGTPFYRRQREGKKPQDIRVAEDLFARRVMSVADDKKSGLVTIAVEWGNPAVAADWANKLAGQLNDEMRLRALNEAEANIRYLYGQLEATGSISLQQSISRLIESEMQKVMLARGTDEYAFRVIDVAEPPMRKSKPKAPLIVAMAFVAGLIFSIILAVASSSLRHAFGAIRGGSKAVGSP